MPLGVIAFGSPAANVSMPAASSEYARAPGPTPGTNNDHCPEDAQSCDRAAPEGSSASASHDGLVCKFSHVTVTNLSLPRHEPNDPQPPTPARTHLAPSAPSPQQSRSHSGQIDPTAPTGPGPAHSQRVRGRRRWGGTGTPESHPQRTRANQPAPTHASAPSPHAHPRHEPQPRTTHARCETGGRQSSPRSLNQCQTPGHHRRATTQHQPKSAPDSANAPQHEHATHQRRSSQSAHS